MIKKQLLVVGAIFLATTCFGQHSWHFRSDNYAGLSIGEMGSYGQVQTINGFSSRSWFLGLGAGLDYYRFRTVPLFLSLSGDLLPLSKRSGIFLKGDGGITLPWYKRDIPPNSDVSSSFRPGAYWDAGMGFRWRPSEHSRNAILLSAAYCVKKLTEHQTLSPYCPDPPTCTVNSQTYIFQYLNHTFLLSLGVEF